MSHTDLLFCRSLGPATPVLHADAVDAGTSYVGLVSLCLSSYRPLLLFSSLSSHPPRYFPFFFVYLPTLMLPLFLPSLSLSYTRESLERFFYLCAGNGRVALHGSESLTRCRRFSPLDSSLALLAPTCLDSNDALPITSLTLAFSLNKATGDVCHLLCPQGKSTLWIYRVDRVARYRAIELINSVRGSEA